MFFLSEGDLCHVTTPRQVLLAVREGRGELCALAVLLEGEPPRQLLLEHVACTQQPCGGLFGGIRGLARLDRH